MTIRTLPALPAFLLLAAAGVVFGQTPEKEPYKSTLTFPPLATYQDATPFASGVKLDPQVQKILDAFFDLLQLNHVDQAYDQLTRGTKIAEKPEEVSQLKTKTNQAVNIYGDIVGRELITVQNVGTHLMRATCLSLGRNYPLRWRFYFYREEKLWRLIDIRVDDRLVDMFDEKPSGADADSK
jgi:hypothetical protein